jgi:CelD/BcsL family acetyltransferase involved in cellulose biosynthesis
VAQAEWISDVERFAELREPWNRVAAGSPFMSWDWLDCWWRAFGDGEEMRVVASWDGDELAAGMAFGLGSRGRLRAMADGNTDLSRPIGRTEEDIDPLAAAVRAGPWSRISVIGLPLDDRHAARLVRALEDDGWLLHRTFRERCPIIDTDGEFDDYRRSLSPNARRQIAKARRRLDREGSVELRPLQPVGELEPVLSESFDLEAAGWKGRSQSAILSSERDSRFWRSVFRRYHELGALRFSELRLDGSLIAFCLGIVDGGRLYAMKTAYDERYSYFAPGHILRLGMIERCFEEAIEAQELLGPMIRWKERYATAARDTEIVRAYRRRPGAVLAYAGRSVVIPRVRPAFRWSRRALDRVRGRREAAAGQSDDVRVDVGRD